MVYVKKLYVAIRYILTLRIPVYASYAGYFLILSAFPSLILLLSLLRYAGLEVEVLTGALRELVPEALFPAAKRLIVLAYQGTTGFYPFLPLPPFGRQAVAFTVCSRG